jgi:phosphoglycolate phosphatase
LRLFFDLDGTLLDSRERLYRLFQNLVPESNLGFEEYWQLKRNMIGHAQILKDMFGYSTLAIEKFEREWMSLIESNEWLAFDKPFAQVTEFISSLKAEHNLYLVTARQSEIMLSRQLATLGWTSLFDKVFVVPQDDSKSTAIQKALSTQPNDWFIGDTGKDVEAGRDLGINTAAVLTGFRNRQQLERYNPTVILESVLDFKA